MGEHRSKEDEVRKISSSIFVTNFPDKCSAKELWTVCKQYGTVVDAFIPDKRSKSGKRFGFVRFIKVFDVDRLVNNLCTIWIRSFKLHANIARFQRTPLPKNNYQSSFKKREMNVPREVHKGKRANGYIRSYAHAVNSALIGEVKDLTSLTNLKKVLAVEERFKSNVGTGSWFTQIIQASNDFSINERVTWVDIEGKVFWVRAKEVSGWVPDFDEEEEEDDSKYDDEASKEGTIDENKNVDGINAQSSPPKKFEMEREDYPLNGHDDKVDSDAKKTSSSTCSGHFQKCEIPRSGGLAQKAKKDWVQELCDKHKVNFLSLQETKMEDIELFNIRPCWGNLRFEHVYSPSFGNSGGILCIWDPRMFRKINFTISDYFVMIQGEWIPNVLNNWNDDVVIMGDFNEVRTHEERHGSIFNVQGADAFNSFISTSGLEDVPLDGYRFTWCHKSASKISKLDSFLISEGLLNSCPNISAITLDRYLSDHRPILLRESHFDYGPTPFQFYFYWFELDGFDNFMEQTWKDAQVNDLNTILKLMKKLKFLKEKIRIWINAYKERSKNHKQGIKDELAELDLLLDRGEGNSDILNKRMNAFKSLQDLDKLDSLEMAQKSKIKWAIEGDENSKYFHGVLNKKRNQLAIRGVLVEGRWIEDPILVKSEFFSHFACRFDKPPRDRLHIEMDFPNALTPDQQMDLENNITQSEIKKAVWDCRVDKSPGPDGFSFGFYRRYWSFMENEVVEAVLYFF
ncbi:RNA-directed DNA polymerase, eukaryota [Tanacetum coccineum]